MTSQNPASIAESAPAQNTTSGSLTDDMAAFLSEGATDDAQSVPEEEVTLQEDDDAEASFSEEEDTAADAQHENQSEEQQPEIPEHVQHELSKAKAISERLATQRDAARKEALTHKYNLQITQEINKALVEKMNALYEKVAEYEELNPYQLKVEQQEMREHFQKRAADMEKEMKAELERSINEARMSEQNERAREQIFSVVEKYQSKGVTPYLLAEEIIRSGLPPEQAAQAIVNRLASLYGAPAKKQTLPKPVSSKASTSMPRQSQAKKYGSIEDEMIDFISKRGK